MSVQHTDGPESPRLGAHMIAHFLRHASHDELVSVLREMSDERLSALAVAAQEVVDHRLRPVRARGNFPAVSTDSGFAVAHRADGGAR